MINEQEISTLPQAVPREESCVILTTADVSASVTGENVETVEHATDATQIAEFTQENVTSITDIPEGPVTVLQHQESAPTEDLDAIIAVEALGSNISDETVRLRRSGREELPLSLLEPLTIDTTQEPFLLGPNQKSYYPMSNVPGFVPPSRNVDCSNVVLVLMCIFCLAILAYLSYATSLAVQYDT